MHYEPDPEHVQEAFSDLIDEEDFLQVGRWVLHPSWGRGQITARDGSGADMKLSIRFGRQVKRVAVAYASLEPA